MTAVGMPIDVAVGTVVGIAVVAHMTNGVLLGRIMSAHSRWHCDCLRIPRYGVQMSLIVSYDRRLHLAHLFLFPRSLNSR